MRQIPINENAIPTYWTAVVFDHSRKTNSPIRIVPAVSKASTVPAATAKPVLAATKPKVMKTTGEIRIMANSQKENLLSPLAQTALTELATPAITTATTT